ncbi:MAG: cyclic nucleotide-binding domain-containing protein [Chloroflexota bacterium]
MKRLNTILPSWLRPTDKIETANGSTSSHNQEFLIDLHQVVKTYETAAGPFTALKGIDLKVSAGEFVMVVGKSGSGKSTLINMITGIDRPTLGEIHVVGTPIHKLSETQMALWRSKNVGVIFQFFQLLPTLSVIENVMLPMEFAGLYSFNERRERGHYLLDLVGLADQAHKLPAMISGGQQQRVAIARSLANDPKLLVADEPTGSLDSKTGDAIFRLFEDFVSQGRTILMVTHDRSLASRVSRVVSISDGEVIDELISDALPNLNETQQVQVLSQLEAETYAPGVEIIRQGDPAEAFFIITRGLVDVVKTHVSGQELLLGQLGVGEYFGETGLLDKGLRTATIKAAADSEVTVMELSRDVFLRLMNESQMTHDEMAHVLRLRAIEADLQGALPELSKDLLADLSQGLTEKTYAPGETIVRQGDPADYFFVLTEGNLDITVEKPDGQEVSIDYLSPGQFFGEVGIIEGGRRTATARVAHDVEAKVLQLDRETLIDLMGDSNVTKDHIMQLLRERAERAATATPKRARGSTKSDKLKRSDLGL